MKIMKIKLNQGQYETLLYLTNGKNIIKTKDMVTLYNKFLGETIKEIEEQSPEYLWFNKV